MIAHNNPKKQKGAHESILIVGALDTSAGAGIVADLRVADLFHIPTQIVLTAIAVQTNRKFKRLIPTNSKFILEQFFAVLEDHNPSTIKIGGLGACDGSFAPWKEIVQEIRTRKIPFVVDPVFQTSTGGNLIQGLNNEAIRKMYCEIFLPSCTLFTPNFPEALFLLQLADLSREETSKQIQSQFPCPTLLKGGHYAPDNDGYLMDTLVTAKEMQTFRHRPFTRGKIRGTGCTLATTLAIYLIREKNILSATKKSIQSVCQLIEAAVEVDPEIFHLSPQKGKKE